VNRESQDEVLSNLVSVQRLIEDWDLHSDSFKTEIKFPLQVIGLELRVISKITETLYRENAEPALKMRNDYLHLIVQDQHETEPGLQLRANLISRLGEGHKLIVDLDRMIRWQSFKLKRSYSSK
jgi:hypothetical protein